MNSFATPPSVKAYASQLSTGLMPPFQSALSRSEYGFPFFTFDSGKVLNFDVMHSTLDRMRQLDRLSGIFSDDIDKLVYRVAFVAMSMAWARRVIPIAHARFYLGSDLAILNPLPVSGLSVVTLPRAKSFGRVPWHPWEDGIKTLQPTTSMIQDFLNRYINPVSEEIADLPMVQDDFIARFHSVSLKYFHDYNDIQKTGLAKVDPTEYLKTKILAVNAASALTPLLLVRFLQSGQVRPEMRLPLDCVSPDGKAYLDLLSTQSRMSQSGLNFTKTQTGLAVVDPNGDIREIPIPVMGIHSLPQWQGWDHVELAPDGSVRMNSDLMREANSRFPPDPCPAAQPTRRRDGRRFYSTTLVEQLGQLTLTYERSLTLEKARLALDTVDGMDLILAAQREIGLIVND